MCLDGHVSMVPFIFDPLAWSHRDCLVKFVDFSRIKFRFSKGAVIGKGEDPMLIMEYMDHGSLYDILHNDTMVLEGELLLPIIRDISLGMRFLHASNPQVVHGDLKSANILVDSKFRAKVSDFGTCVIPFLDKRWWGMGSAHIVGV